MSNKTESKLIIPTDSFTKKSQIFNYIAINYNFS